MNRLQVRATSGLALLTVAALGLAGCASPQFQDSQPPVDDLTFQPGPDGGPGESADPSPSRSVPPAPTPSSTALPKQKEAAASTSPRPTPPDGNGAGGDSTEEKPSRNGARQGDSAGDSPGTEEKKSATSSSGSGKEKSGASRSTPKASASPSRPPASSGGGSSVGVTDRDALKPSSVSVLREDGAVLEDVVVSGDLLVSGDDQELRNVRVEGGLKLRGSGTTVEDADVGALSISGGSQIVVRNVDVSGQPGKDGIHITSDSGRVADVLIEGSRIHSPKVTGNSHYDGIQVRGVDGLVLRGNSFELGSYKRQFTAAIFLENANGGNRDVTVDSNYIDGGGYTLLLGGTNTRVTNNTFGPNDRWGLLHPGSKTASVTFSGNVRADGRAVSF